MFEGGAILRFHNIWLRDHCLCHHCRDPTTRQRSLDTASIPPRVAIFDIRVDDAGRALHLEWEEHDVNHTGWAAPSDGEQRIPARGHVSRFPVDWLVRHAYWRGGDGDGAAPLAAASSSVDPAPDASGRILWGRAHFGDPTAPLPARSFPTVRYDE